jgi:hypothetical protein
VVPGERGGVEVSGTRYKIAWEGEEGSAVG